MPNGYDYGAPMRQFGQGLGQLATTLQQNREKRKLEQQKQEINDIFKRNMIPDPEREGRIVPDKQKILSDLYSKGYPDQALSLSQKWSVLDAQKARMAGGQTQGPAGQIYFTEEGVPMMASRDPKNPFVMPLKMVDPSADVPKVGKTGKMLTDKEGNQFMVPKGSSQAIPIKTPEGEQLQDPSVLVAKDKLKIADKTLDLKEKPAQSAIDKAYAKEYTDFWIGGKSADAVKGISQLNNVISRIKQTGTVTGPAIGLVPKLVKDLGLPESADIQDLIEEIVQRNLRLVLGAQFTEREGTRLIERAYNPRLPEEKNIARLTRLMNQMNSAFQSKKRAAEYYEKNQTLAGFDISSFIDSPNDMLIDVKTKEKVPTIKTDAEYNALPSGSEFIDPEGNKRRKP